MSTIIRFGLDLAKNNFVVAGVDEHEKLAVKKCLRRVQLLEFFANTPPAIVAMEAGSAAHHWARKLIALGHDARIIDARKVKPFRITGPKGKNDLNDAIAICEAAGRPHMRFVPVKSVEQQAVLVVHRARASAVREHTRLANQLRGLLAEFGIVVAAGVDKLKAHWPELRLRHADDVPLLAWNELDTVFERLVAAHRRVLDYDRKLAGHVRRDERAQRVAEVTGIGVVSASALVASIADPHEFRNGRQFAASLGLTPRQRSTGARQRLGRITKEGDTYLRTLLVHGARSELTRTAGRNDAKSQWAEALKRRMGWNKASVALANKHARIAWAILAHGERFRPVAFAAA